MLRVIVVKIFCQRCSFATGVTVMYLMSRVKASTLKGGGSNIPFSKENVFVDELALVIPERGDTFFDK